ncbi:unnamed protein product, partial [Porites evermanni]
VEYPPQTLGFPPLLTLGYPPRPIYQQSPRSSLNLQCFFRLKWLLLPARWVGPETKRIPQPVPDPNNWGHFMDVYQTESTSRTPNDLPRKCLKDLYGEHSVSIINDGNTIKSFCSKNKVDEKHVITYVNHLKVIDIRKDIRTREAERQEEERTYKDFKWDTLI